MKTYFLLVTCLFISLINPVVSKAEDFALTIKESMLNKAISSKKTWEYKDDKAGVYLKLSNLKFFLKEGFIVGNMNLDKYKQNTSTGNHTLDGLLKRASEINGIAAVQLTTQIGLAPDHHKIVLKNTKFTHFNNRYLPAFIENGFILSQLNKQFAHQIDGKVIYEFPESFQLDISDIMTSVSGIQIKGDLLMPCSLN